tara:strand:+ start:1107 stop:1304 length:198 start_codon:yes stop_codon:yes gene_type:complete
MIALTTPEQIAHYRLLTLKQGLEMEIKGLRLTRGRTCYSIIKQEFGLKGNKKKVYDQFVKIVEGK